MRNRDFSMDNLAFANPRFLSLQLKFTQGTPQLFSDKEAGSNKRLVNSSEYYFY